MFLLRIIKILSIGIFFFAFQFGNAQSFQTSKYNKEHNPYFKFETFERGVKSEILSKKLDRLELKSKANWTIEDSIEFAEISLLTKNTALSQYYLESIVGDNHYSKHAIRLLLMDCYIDNDFVTGDKIIDKYFDLNNREDKYFSSIYFSHKKLIEKKKTDTVIFGILPRGNASIVKGSEHFYRNIISPVETANSALRFYVKFIHEDDPILARAFNEIGIVLWKHVSLNQAYVSFNIARIYNSKDKEILENVKSIKAEHVNNNYNTPKFRTYFPRIEYWRFDYDILKEKIIREKNDTIPKFTPKLIQPVQKKSFPFSLDILIPIGIGVILLLFLIFTKSKKIK